MPVRLSQNKRCIRATREPSNGTFINRTSSSPRSRATWYRSQGVISGRELIGVSRESTRSRLYCSKSTYSTPALVGASEASTSDALAESELSRQWCGQVGRGVSGGVARPARPEGLRYRWPATPPSQTMGAMLRQLPAQCPGALLEQLRAQTPATQ